MCPTDIKTCHEIKLIDRQTKQNPKQTSLSLLFVTASSSLTGLSSLMQNQQAGGGHLSSPRKTSPRRRRRLYELLEEQQEPFLFDHGYSGRNHGVRCKIFCWSGNNAGRVLQWLSSLRRLKWRRGTGILRWKISRKVLHWGPDTRSEGFERLYCSGVLSEGGVQPDNGEGDKEQLSPVSVLEAKEELHQTERLLLDCVEEIMEGRIRDSNRKMESLIALNLSEPWEEWSHFQTEIGEIAMDVEGAIFEEIIREEAVENILGSHYKLERC